MRRVVALTALLILTMAGTVVAEPAIAVAAGGAAEPVTGIRPTSYIFTPVASGLGSDWDQVSIAVDAEHHIHLAAGDSYGNIWYLTDRTGHWTERRVMTAVDEDCEFCVRRYDDPLIALDTDGRVYIAASIFDYDDYPCGVDYVTDKQRTRGTFSAPTPLLEGWDFAVSLGVAGGHVHLASENYDEWEWDTLHLTTNASGTWTHVKVGSSARASMRVSARGQARIVYLSVDQRIRYAVATSAGDSIRNEAMPHTSTADWSPKLALDPKGRSRVVWLHRSSSGWSIRYSIRNSTGWSYPSTVALVSEPSDLYDFDVDSNGLAHVIYFDSQHGRLHDALLGAGGWTHSTISTAYHVGTLAVGHTSTGTVVIAFTTEDRKLYVGTGDRKVHVGRI